MKRLWLGLLVITGLAGHAPAQADEAPELPVRVVHYYLDYRIGDDAAAVESRDWAMTVLQQRAVDYAKRASITYSTSIQKAEVLAAYTQKPDGRRIDAPKSNFQIEANSGKDKNAPVFCDWTTLTVVFPEVAVGDTVFFSYRVTETEPMFPGQFSEREVFGRNAAYDDVRVRIDAPAKLWVQYLATQMQETRPVEKDGRKLYQWTYRNPQPVKDKRRDYSVYDVEGEPGLAFSTFHSHADIAEAYGLRARPKAKPDERVRKLAADIAGKAKEPREQARALYDWVATNITYAGNCIGTGAVVPHDLAFILDNKMGDCKDHATLLQALLAARDIASTQALVNAGSTYRLPKIPVVSDVNHVINYLPALGLYADSTSRSTPFGMLPVGDADKPVLLVDGGDAKAHTPAAAIGSNRQEMKSHLKIAGDGSLSGEIEIALTGIFGASMRAALRNLPKDQEADLVEHVFQRNGYIGKGSLEKDDPTALLDGYRYKVKFELKSFTPLPGPAAFAVAPVFPTEAPVASFSAAAVADDVTYDVACTNGVSTEEYTYELPENMKVLATPDNVDFSEAGFLSYHAEYRLQDRQLTVRRMVDDRTSGSVCGPEISAAYKTFAKRMLQDLKSQVVYK